MENNVKTARSLQYYMRTVHRVIGYIVLGMTLVYALGGIVMVYRTTDFMKGSTVVEQTLQPGMDANALGAALKLKSFKVTDETPEIVAFTDGEYNKVTGEVVYEKKELIEPLNRFTVLHKLPFTKSPVIGVITTIYGIALFLLALTALFMYKASSKQFIANMVYTTLGVVIVFLLLIFV